jgi:hypothetical protein
VLLQILLGYATATVAAINAATASPLCGRKASTEVAFVVVSAVAHKKHELTDKHILTAFAPPGNGRGQPRARMARHTFCTMSKVSQAQSGIAAITCSLLSSSSTLLNSDKTLGDNLHSLPYPTPAPEGADNRVVRTLGRKPRQGWG